MTKKKDNKLTKIQKRASSKHGLATKLVRGGIERSHMSETSETLFLTSGFVYNSFLEAYETFDSDIKTDRKFVYARFGSPTSTMLESKLALVEDAKFCFTTSTGMSASFSSIIPFLKPGDKVVSAKSLFSSNNYILTTHLKNWQVEVEFVNGANLDEWQSAISKKSKAGRNCRLVFFETPSNPLLGIVDIQKVSQIAKEVGALVVVDNAIASPILQKPLNLGADIVFHSATKILDGQGRVLAGAVLTNNAKIANDVLTPFLRNLGFTLSAFNAWVLIKSLDTLEIRIKQQIINAKLVVDFLSKSKKIKKVYYPGLTSHQNHKVAKKQMKDFGSLLAFEIISNSLSDTKKNVKSVAKMFDNLKLIDISNNLGDTKTLITHPATTTHQSLSQKERDEQGITDSVVRLSVGLEDAKDIIADLEQALNKI